MIFKTARFIRFRAVFFNRYLIILATVRYIKNMIKPDIYIIGLNSPAPQSGKSTVSNFIANSRDTKVYSIASGIRDIARQRGLYYVAEVQGKEKDAPVDWLGGKTPREVLIDIGLEMRQLYGERFWIDRVIKKIFEENVSGLFLIDDVRTVEDGEVIKNNNGIVITINRDSAVYNPNDVMGFVPVINVDNNGAVWECARDVMKHANDFWFAKK